MKHETVSALTTSIQFTSDSEYRQKCSSVISLSSYITGARVKTEIMLGIYKKEFETTRSYSIA